MKKDPAAQATPQTNSMQGTIQPYDIFMVGLALLSVVNLIMYIFLEDEVLMSTIWSIDLLLSGFFFIDFLRRLYGAPSRFRYFFLGYGWADLLASLPFPQFKLLRLIRIIKAYLLVKRIGGERVIHQLKASRASNALYLMFFLIILLLEFGSIAVLSAEQSNPTANINTASDAIWWVYVTITTVGYGDLYPTTTAGRLLGALVMMVGVGLFAVLTGYLANKFLPTSSDSAERDADKTLARVHAELAEIKQTLAELSDSKLPR